MRKASLGKGLRQLISGDGLAQSRAVIEVSVERLRPNPFQPRGPISQEGLRELSESVRTQGILQPLVVRRLGEDYQVVIGERRWRAAQEVGLETVPCIVQEIGDEEALELALVENIQREDLSCVEAARGYRQLVEEFGLTQEEVAGRVGKSRSAVANALRLLQLPVEVQIALGEGRLSEGHGRALLGLGEALDLVDDIWGEALDLVDDIWREVEEKEMTVRETEALVREVREKGGRRRGEKGEPPVVKPDAYLADMVERLQETLATRVRIKVKGDDGGTILIEYHSEEELERLVSTITPEDII